MVPTPTGASADGDVIPLTGSADLITEFFSYGLNTLLYQRGLYPPEAFSRHSKYGMTMLVTTDERVQAYLQSVLDQMNEWLKKLALRRVAVIMVSVATAKVLERWVFDVVLEDEDAAGAIASGSVPASEPSPGSKEEAKIVAEIQALLRQITASVAFLPLLNEACSFDVLIYTTEDTETPVKWEESGPKTITNAQHVQLRSFSTSVHQVGTAVSFAPPAPDE